MSGVSRRRKAENKAALQRMRGGAEMALINDYTLQTLRARDEDHAAVAEYIRVAMDARPMRIGSADISFTVPPGEMPTVELAEASYFGIDAGVYDLWNGNRTNAPGPTKPLPRPGTRARAVRLRGRVGVLQDAWHEAGVWPWLDGQKFVSKPWELTMVGLRASIERMSREDAARRYPAPSHAARMDMARAAVDSGFVTPEQGARLLDHGTMTLTDVVHAESPAPPPKRGRVPAFIPVRRLDGRR